MPFAKTLGIELLANEPAVETDVRDAEDLFHPGPAGDQRNAVVLQRRQCAHDRREASPCTTPAVPYASMAKMPSSTAKPVIKPIENQEAPLMSHS
jgi:hypothetical protein